MAAIWRRFVKTTRALVHRHPLFTIPLSTNIIISPGFVELMSCSNPTSPSADAMESFTMVSLTNFSPGKKLISQLSENGAIRQGSTNCKTTRKNIQNARLQLSEVTHGHYCQRPASVSQNHAITPTNAPTKVRIACAKVTSTS
jgi:hypothetical protein